MSIKSIAGPIMGLPYAAYAAMMALAGIYDRKGPARAHKMVECPNGGGKERMSTLTAEDYAKVEFSVSAKFLSDKFGMTVDGVEKPFGMSRETALKCLQLLCGEPTSLVGNPAATDKEGKTDAYLTLAEPILVRGRKHPRYGTYQFSWNLRDLTLADRFAIIEAGEGSGYMGVRLPEKIRFVPCAASKPNPNGKNRGGRKSKTAAPVAETVPVADPESAQADLDGQRAAITDLLDSAAGTDTTVAEVLDVVATPAPKVQDPPPLHRHR